MENIEHDEDRLVYSVPITGRLTVSVERDLPEAFRESLATLALGAAMNGLVRVWIRDKQSWDEPEGEISDFLNMLIDKDSLTFSIESAEHQA